MYLECPPNITTIKSNKQLNKRKSMASNHCTPAQYVSSISIKFQPAPTAPTVFAGPALRAMNKNGGEGRNALFAFLIRVCLQIMNWIRIATLIHQTKGSQVDNKGRSWIDKYWQRSVKIQTQQAGQQKLLKKFRKIDFHIYFYCLYWSSFEQMATVPKLSYTSLKSKNRIKDEANDELYLSNRSSDLFAHMNKDNLAYIQGQIKEKRKKNTVSSKQIKANQERKSQQVQLEEEGYPETPQLLSPEISGQPVVKTEGQNKAFQNAEMLISLDMKRKFSQLGPQYEPNKEEKPCLKPKKAMLTNLVAFEQKSKNTINNNKHSGDNFLNFLQNYIHDLNTEKSHHQTKRNTQQSHEFKKKQHLRPPTLSCYYNSSDRFQNSQRITNLQSQVSLLYSELISVKELLFNEQSPQQVVFRSPAVKERSQSRSLSAFGQNQQRMDNREKYGRIGAKRDDKNQKNAIEELRLVQEQYEDFLRKGTIKLKKKGYV